MNLIMTPDIQIPVNHSCHTFTGDNNYYRN